VVSQIGHLFSTILDPQLAQIDSPNAFRICFFLHFTNDFIPKYVTTAIATANIGARKAIKPIITQNTPTINRISRLSNVNST